MIDYRISSQLRGPVFDGRAPMLMRRYIREMEQEVAEYAHGLVHFHLAASLRNPTGYYQSHVQIRWRRGHPEVSDGGRIVYGPWLEGVGSRNFPETRFRGYATFRRVGQVVQRDAGRIGDRVWQRQIGRW